MPNKLNPVDVANAIRTEATDEYRARVPAATLANIRDVGNPLLEYQTMANEFVSALVNKIGFTIVRRQTFSNPLSALKKGLKPLGVDIEDIFVNPAEAYQYDPSGVNLLARKIPDVKAAYYRLNRQDQYKRTVNRLQLAHAFTSWENFGSLIDAIVESLYNGNYIDEFELMKRLAGDAISQGKVQQEVAPVVIDEASAKAFTKIARGTALAIRFPSTRYNGYLLNGGTGNPVKTWTPEGRQIIVIRSDVEAALDVDALAYAFNMDKASLVGRKYVIDTFETAPNALALIADESFFQVWDEDFSTDVFYNPEGRYWNYYLNAWQTYSACPFANAIALVTAKYPTP